ncbi:MAG: hypothetical protein ACLSFT_09340 [Ruminococcus callidus]
MAQKPRKPEDRHHGHEHGRHGFSGSGFLLSGHHADIRAYDNDFIWQGFEQGEKDGCKEWPVPHASTLSWQGKPLAYMPFVYEHPMYYQKIQEETKGSGDITAAPACLSTPEKAREHTEEEMIKVENIKGKLILIGAEDDSFWKRESMFAAWNSG